MLPLRLLIYLDQGTLEPQDQDKQTSKQNF